MLVVLITPPPVDEDGRMEYAKYVNSSPYINCFLGRPPKYPQPIGKQQWFYHGGCSICYFLLQLSTI